MPEVQGNYDFEKQDAKQPQVVEGVGAPEIDNSPIDAIDDWGSQETANVLDGIHNKDMPVPASMPEDTAWDQPPVAAEEEPAGATYDFDQTALPTEEEDIEEEGGQMAA